MNTFDGLLVVWRFYMAGCGMRDVANLWEPSECIHSFRKCRIGFGRFATPDIKTVLYIIPKHSFAFKEGLLSPAFCARDSVCVCGEQTIILDILCMYECVYVKHFKRVQTKSNSVCM